MDIEKKLRAELDDYIHECRLKGGATEEDIKKLFEMADKLTAINSKWRKFYHDIINLKGSLPPGVFI